MKVLLVDLGNTRIKWARLGPRGVGRQKAAAHAGWQAADFSRALFGSAARDALASGIRVVAVSVASEPLRRAFAGAVRAATGRAPLFCTSVKRAGGVRNAYREPWRLGADRWIALVGARALCSPAPALVVDIGTATTLDLLDGRGVHRGGAILPGPALMIESLLRDTGGIRRRAGGAARGRRPFARDTASALAAGALHGTAGAIDRAFAQARRELRSRSVRLILTGGAAAAIAPLLIARASLVPDLVLQGLAVLAPPKTAD